VAPCDRGSEPHENVVPAKQGNVVTVFLAIEIEQAVEMPIPFMGHCTEQPGVPG
jgi:hypothetical protein